MTTEQNKSIVRRFNKEFIEGGNMDSFHEIISTEFVNQSAPPGVPTGSDGVLYFFNQVLKPSFSNFKVEIFDQAAEDDKVTTRKAFHASHTGEFFWCTCNQQAGGDERDRHHQVKRRKIYRTLGHS